jgi:ribonuclease HI
MDLVYIYADESCLGNQYRDRDSPGGAGGLVEFWREGACVRRDYWASEPGTTNNRMALIGAADLLAALKRPCRIIFTSDSQYLVTGMREWIHGWAARGWKRKTGAIENVELWRALAGASGRHEIDWRWVRGHAGHPQNEYVDELAVRAVEVRGVAGSSPREAAEVHGLLRGRRAGGDRVQAGTNAALMSVAVRTPHQTRRPRHRAQRPPTAPPAADAPWRSRRTA